ncbi:biotin--[acetyl-CoA-carboxylase] ligase [Sphingomonas sp. LY29]|uniref:biotin--[acetyl-CoA-carboxylase] ligase n=1 Tax=Sphingomonas sp. LY29 TaxID=3095341 RepID=UPI002D780F86|nr:biotin--[acetyl-CoA-carboxylase] ligase [Sphingomonas sp. LY29]WRP27122.1 biotin--[acetyl-CoA-carboxylase] ligase [Sphingomonas sp. LY29]
MVERTGSTNSDLLSDDQAIEGDWLIALVQDGGRGRHGRVWQSVDGNFLGSTLVQVRAGDPSSPALALAAGLALIEALDSVASAAPLSLKWPNDLMLGNAKLAGILLERSGQRIVAGFGVNLAAAPEIGGRRTTALAPLATIAPQAFAPLLAASFARMLASWRHSNPASFAQAWQARAHPIGTPLEVHSGPGQRVAGRFAGIEPDGAMRLTLPDGATEIVRAGDVSFA